MKNYFKSVEKKVLANVSKLLKMFLSKSVVGPNMLAQTP
jgi:hypothetical protein